MSKNHHNAPRNAGQTVAEKPDAVTENESSHKIELVDIRKECIKIVYSASKSVTEILNDAELVAHWVSTGEKQKPE